MSKQAHSQYGATATNPEVASDGSSGGSSSSSSGGASGSSSGSSSAGPAAGSAAHLNGVLRIYAPTGGVHATALADCARAYARGDFRMVRRLAHGVCVGPAEADERAFAEELLRRTAIDPVALWTGIVCFALFWLIVYLTVWR